MHIVVACAAECFLSRSSFSVGTPLPQVTNGEKGFLAYETRFWFPSEQSMSYSPFYYSYEVRFLARQNAEPSPCSTK